MIDRQHVDREGAFHRGVHVKVVQDDLGVCVPLEFQFNPGFLVREVPEVANVSNDLFLNETCNPFDQLSAIDVVRYLADDDLFPSILRLFDRGGSAYLQTASAGFEILANPGRAIDGAAGWEIGPFDVFE